MQHADLTERIIGSAFRVYNTLRFGFLESVYERARLIELRDAGLRAVAQQPINVFYRDEVVGQFVADLIVNDTVIIELKSVQQTIAAHEAQLVNYLVATRKPVGLLLNFGPNKLEVSRKVPFLPGSDPDHPVDPV